MIWFFLTLDRANQFSFDRITIGHLDRGSQHFGQRKLSVFGLHGQDSAGRSGRNRRKRSVFGRIFHVLCLEEIGGCAGWRHTQSVDRDHLLCVRIENQRLRFASPTQRVPHGAGRGNHGAGRIHGVSAFLESHGTGGGGERLTRDGHPMISMKDRLFGLLGY